MTRPARNTSGPHRPRPSGQPIRPGELWPIALLHTRLGWGARSRAAAIRQGLPVHRWNKYAYVSTTALIAFLESQPAGNGKPLKDHL